MAANQPNGQVAGGPGDQSPLTRKQWQDRLQTGKAAINLRYLIRVGNRRMARAQAARLVHGMLDGEDLGQQVFSEASVHKPRRGKIWVASYTGPDGGQLWKTTGTEDYSAAVVIAREFEAVARAQRAQSGSAGPKRRIWNRQSPGGTGSGLTQREVAVMLKISERAARELERRAIRKLAQHPQLREIWRQYLAGELDEQTHHLSAAEIQALLGLVRSRAERETLLKVLAIIQN